MSAADWAAVVGAVLFLGSTVAFLAILAYDYVTAMRDAPMADDAPTPAIVLTYPESTEVRAAVAERGDSWMLGATIYAPYQPERLTDAHQN